MCMSIGHAGVSVHGLLTGLRELAGLARLAELGTWGLGDLELGRGSAKGKLAGVWFDALALLEKSDQWRNRTDP